ncbi:MULTISPECIES: hypothetical protein [unclassified Prochlorococcus]|uniref:hypothetical protein n=1 Tax=unclassified Prochlorococcus TaxID=2627481 RepID=UPI00053382EE|nr:MULTISPECIES: hypothetical protein [unclassified Prochlorococcus]KGG14937.1 hypothetical protein EV06_2004 [Prochlorococcus sp. MIT 0602]KGG15629.1 hypothetical protein EV07_1594 [Prochlorococcus sp. MIT 0603]
MNNITKIVRIGIPTAIGVGVAWLGARIIQNERKLVNRKIELELQLGNKALKGP